MYKILTSEDHDWFITVKKEGDEVKILYENHSRADAYKHILLDMGLDFPVEERDMSSGGYDVTLKDFLD